MSDVSPALSSPVIALVGNPNCGKTALFNALTRQPPEGRQLSRRHGREEGRAARHTGRPDRAQLSTCPAPIPLRARSPDEEITRDVVLGRAQNDVTPDLIVCVADASNLELALRLALELKQVGRPVMLSLNMMDIARSRGIEIDADRLSRELGVPVGGARSRCAAAARDALLAEIDRRLASSTDGGWNFRLAAPGCRRPARRPARGRPHPRRRWCAGRATPTA